MSRRLSIAAGMVLFVALTAAPAFAQEKPVVVSHDLAGKDNCLMCHSGAMEGMKAVPASHEGRANDTCLWCHGADSEVQTTEVPAIPHELEGRESCSMCHSGAMEGMPAVPASHEGRGDDMCLMCHTAAG
jgi:hypothetical protein